MAPGAADRPRAAAAVAWSLVALAACGSRETPAPASRADAGAAATVDGGPACPAARPEISLGSLLDEMTALDRLARRSAVPFRVYQFSSRDPRSRAPSAPDEGDDQTGWFANHDWGNFVRVEKGAGGRTEHVVLDVQGPGAIVRFWSATPFGTLRFYVDDMERPVLEAQMQHLLRGEVAPFTPPFAQLSANGGNLDFPFPFRRRAKVTIEGEGEKLFYQAFVRRYDDTGCVDVVPYLPGQVSTEALDAARDRLRGTGPVDPTLRKSGTMLGAASDRVDLLAQPGGSEIVELIMSPSDRSPAALRQSYLSFTFDGVETVRAPLGDFFGAGPGLLPLRTLPLEVKADGTFTCRFAMPFARTAVLKLVATPGMTVSTSVAQRARAFDDGTYHFYAQWIARGPLPVRPFRDLAIAGVRGEGAYVGTTLSLQNSETHWWGEGDEKVWVDDDVSPSWFGTGTEDYFGYAYNTRELFDHPYRTQSLVGRPVSAGFDYRGQVANGRYHLLDVIRHRERLRFDLELFHWDPRARVSYDTVAYFYARPGSVLEIPLASPGDMRLPPALVP